MTIVPSSTAFSGFYEPGHRGVICPYDTALDRQQIVGSSVGARASGTASWLSYKQLATKPVNWTGKCISWTGQLFVPTNMLPGQKSCPDAEALGRNRRGPSTKLHVRAEGGGKLITFVFSPGQWHKQRVVRELL